VEQQKSKSDKKAKANHGQATSLGQFDAPAGTKAPSETGAQLHSSRKPTLILGMTKEFILTLFVLFVLVFCGIYFFYDSGFTH
jgi:hypothetical protein